ncbi:MAG: glycine zipper 2TM domain-containing protein [Bdellovibrionales bacterium]|nr:glycine zipper 2TM domain-containing protein [Bdellovibrionales bacterium]
MHHSWLALLLGVLLIGAGGCSTWNKLDRTEKGAVIGGGSGALVGSQVGEGAGGALVGGALGATAGGVIGHETDDDDT